MIKYILKLSLAIFPPFLTSLQTFLAPFFPFFVSHLPFVLLFLSYLFFPTFFYLSSSSTTSPSFLDLFFLVPIHTIRI